MDFLKNLSIYTFVTFFNKGAAFLLIPVFTNYLSKSEYGELALVLTLVAFVTPFIDIGIQGAINVEYHKLNKIQRPIFILSGISLSVLAFIIIGGLFLFFSKEIAGLIGIQNTSIIKFVPIIVYTQTIITITDVLFRIQEKSVRYAFFSISFTLINLLLSVFLVVQLHSGYEGRVYAILISNILFVIISFYLLRNWKLLSNKVSKQYVKEIWLFGAPLIFHLLANVVVNMSDRVFISRMIGNDALGVYQAGYQIGSIVSFFSMAFVAAYSPYVMKLLHDGSLKSRKKIVKINYYFFSVLIVLVFVLYLITPVIFGSFLIGEGFKKGSVYVIWVALGYLFLGGYFTMVNYLFFLKKTNLIAILAFINVAINLVLNYWFISKWGAIGAAYSTCISFLIILVVVSFISHKYYPMPWFNKVK